MLYLTKQSFDVANIKIPFYGLGEEIAGGSKPWYFGMFSYLYDKTWVSVEGKISSCCS